MADRTTNSPAQAAIELRHLLETLGREGARVVQRVCGREVPEPWTVYPGESGVFDRSAVEILSRTAIDVRRL